MRVQVYKEAPSLAAVIEMDAPYLELVDRLRERARIRRQIPNRKSVQEGKPDRIADLLEEAAETILNILERSND